MNVRVKHAMKVLRMEGISDDIKEEARNMLKNYFATIGHPVFEAYIDGLLNTTIHSFAKQATPPLVSPHHCIQKLQRHFGYVLAIITFSIYTTKERNMFRLVIQVYAKVM
ncbi:hypothetical protein F5I97DRAFT_1829852 [Phlebopus sp. FC_14]|nr:hypothetical protein F5I97DRAFT_1829852 [Phlebopus sp. FC_14]